jgi:hypothetical protein
MISYRTRTFAGCVIAMTFLLVTLPIRAQDTMAEAKTVAAYPLTMDHVTRLFQVSADVPSDKTMSDLTLEDKIKRIDATPKLSAGLKAHGISSRDFVMTGAAMGAAIAVSGLMDTGEKGPGASLPNQIEWAAAPPDHIKFYRDHKAEIDKLVEQMIQAMRNRK